MVLGFLGHLCSPLLASSGSKGRAPHDRDSVAERRCRRVRTPVNSCHCRKSRFWRIITDPNRADRLMSEANRMTFWSWYRRSARTDGALVSAPRRALGAALAIALLIGWYLWTSRTEPSATNVILRQARTHPFCFLGIVLAFALMGLRGVALKYLAYSVYLAQGVRLRWVLFFGVGEGELRRRYEETFGKDKFFRAPAFCQGLSLLIFAVSGLALVFTSR
jgi:hypothetical protein